MMTHCERIIAALSHEQPDMVPIDFGGTVNSSIVVEGYEKLLQHFGIEAESRIVQRMTRIWRAFNIQSTYHADFYYLRRK